MTFWYLFPWTVPKSLKQYWYWDFGLLSYVSVWKLFTFKWPWRPQFTRIFLNFCWILVNFVESVEWSYELSFQLIWPWRDVCFLRFFQLIKIMQCSSSMLMCQSNLWLQNINKLFSSSPAFCTSFHFVMVALWNRADHYIFMLFLLSSFFISSPNLIGWRLDVYHTSTHGVALVRI